MSRKIEVHYTHDTGRQNDKNNIANLVTIIFMVLSGYSILVQVTIDYYCRLRIGREDHLDLSEAYVTIIHYVNTMLA